MSCSWRLTFKIINILLGCLLIVFSVYTYYVIFNSDNKDVWSSPW